MYRSIAKIRKGQSLRITAAFIGCIALIVASVPSFYTNIARAANCDISFYERNNIDFYSACESTCTISSNATGGGVFSSDNGDVKKVVDYKNSEIFTDADIKAIKQNLPFYQKTAEKEKVPWEMLAVVHYRETHLSRDNHQNGQGIYQDYERGGNGGKDYPPGPVSDEEFQRQTDYAAQILKAKAGDKVDALAEGDDDAVKYTFFGYNGRAGAYIRQAKSLGFTDDEAANGEGSPYVMNKADSQRDPNVNGSKWGQIKSDGGAIVYPANQDHGAFVMYAALKGNIASSCGNDGSLASGGLTEDQAKKLMMNYGENRLGDSYSSMMKGAAPGTGCDGGPMSNCVSFSAFFLGKFTDSRYMGGNGKDVVDRMAAAGVPTGTEPKVFAVFSNGLNTEFGHTGVILGIEGTKLIVGHASCSNPGSGRGNGLQAGGGAGYVYVGTIETGALVYKDSPKFAYPQNVNTSEIMSYIGG
ncbi:MAG: hypothetical protein WAQ22_04505 [Candidatus Saccharimonas sp.]